VLLGERHIAEAITGALGASAAVPVAPPASEPDLVPGAAPIAASGAAHIAVSGAAHIAVSGAAPVAVPVTAPKLNSNDATYLVLDWLVADGDRVQPGTPLVEVETSKAVEEIAATAAGVVRIRAPKGSEVSVGALLAEVVGAGARAPARQSGPGSAGSYILDRVQRGVAAVVSRAHREVPAAFSAIEVRVDPLVERLRRFSDRTGAEVGLPEAVVKAVGLAHDDFGRLFGSMVDEQTVALAEAPDVAVTVDAGRGLYSPVIRDCAKRSIGDISDDLMEFRMKAMRGEFTAADLAGGAITVSLNTEDGVLLVHPIVMWPQLCMLSLGGLRERVVLENGEPAIASVVTLGLAYDHRAVNGGEAVAFLRAVATTLGDPGALFR